MQHPWALEEMEAEENGELKRKSMEVENGFHSVWKP